MEWWSLLFRCLGDSVGEVWVILVYVWLGPRGLFAGADRNGPSCSSSGGVPTHSTRTPLSQRPCQGSSVSRPPGKTYKIIVSVSFFSKKNKSSHFYASGCPSGGTPPCRCSSRGRPRSRRCTCVTKEGISSWIYR